MTTSFNFFSILCFLFTVTTLAAKPPIVISPQPIAVAYTPNSIISKQPEGCRLFTGKNSRFSTCTGVAWLPGNTHLISANLIDCSLLRYEFIKKENLFCPIEYISRLTSRLSRPENLSLSKDGKLLAIPNSAGGKVVVYQVNESKNSLIFPYAACLKSQKDNKIHGARFSPDSRYLAYVTIDHPGRICFYQLEKEADGNINFIHKQSLTNPLDPLKPKGIDFSSDGQFVAICYSKRADNQPNVSTGALATYKFDSKEGALDLAPISMIDEKAGLSIPEDVWFYPDNSCLLVSNQENNTITIHTFDKQTGKIGESYVGLKNPTAQLNFPHGFSISSDGKFLAVSNYGDDKVTIYSINKK